MIALGLACTFGAGCIVGHYWGAEIWPWIKGKISK
jgi:hypothetical protein